MNIKDNLFYKLISLKKFDLSKEIFIDRNPALFSHILDYLRTKKIFLKRFNWDQLFELKEEAIYYELLDLEKTLEDATFTVEYVKMEVQSPYNTLNSFLDPKYLLMDDLTKGVCTNSGYIILELNREVEFEKIELGGFTGDGDWVYSDGYGVGTTIETSLDKKYWVNVGVFPTGFGTTIIPVKITKSKAKYIRLNYNSWIGLGYFKVVL
jgi:hypothetical protein